MERLFDATLLARQSCEAEFQPCSLSSMPSSDEWGVAGLFAGVGGIELGLKRAGMHTELLCEYWDPAVAVLGRRFEGVPLVRDVRQLQELPPVRLVAAGFPCTDLSQAGFTRGIRGEASGLVAEVFRLLERRRVPWVLLENVRNMLVLDGGAAMNFLVSKLEALGYQWAYRLVDSRFTGVPQRRQRVILVAAREGDPRGVLFADDAGEPELGFFDSDVFGFYWTEGLRGLGWAQDAVPTLKGGSTIGIPSPPAIWHRLGEAGRRVVTPNITEAERLQGFDANWTAPAESVSNRKGTRWKLVGNAVTVGVAEWVGSRLCSPGSWESEVRQLDVAAPWPKAACGINGKRWSVDVSMWPVRGSYTHLSDVVDLEAAAPLSERAAAGFFDRATRGSLRFEEGFLDDLADHITTIAAA